MLFPKETRKLLHRFVGVIEIEWPPGAPVEPKPGHSYAVQSQLASSGTTRIVVEQIVSEAEGKTMVKVRVTGDHVRSQVTKARRRHDDKAPIYTREGSGTESEPERVPAYYEQLLAEEAAIRNALAQSHAQNLRTAYRAEQKIAKRRAAGKPVSLQEGERDRALRRAKEAAEHPNFPPIEGV